MNADVVAAGVGNLVASQEVGKQSVGYGVSVDKERLLATELPPHITDQAKINQLGAMIENFSKLPERLQFEPGITLIVGNNGTGKSTLSRALHLASTYAEVVNYKIARGASPEDARKSAAYIVDKPTYKENNTTDIELRAAGIPQEIAGAFVGDVSLGSDISPRYTDIGQIFGEHIIEARRNAESRDSMGDQMITAEDGSRKIVNMTVRTEGELDQSHGSTRQTIDRELAHIKENRATRASKRGETGPFISFVGEPETGLSPSRHNNLEAEISNIFLDQAGDTVIVPTNSVILYNSDLPRIDLDFPERGIHRPSMYADHN